MKKIGIGLIIGLTMFFCYQNTMIYLWFHSNDLLVKKIQHKEYEDIDFEKLLPLIKETSNNQYDDFLLNILKEKETLDKPICHNCAYTITMTANEILNLRYNKKIRYISYYDILNQVNRVNNNEYYYSMDEEILKKLQYLTKDLSTYNTNKKEILKIIHENNNKIIQQWESIIKNN